MDVRLNAWSNCAKSGTFGAARAGFDALGEPGLTGENKTAWDRDLARARAALPEADFAAAWAAGRALPYDEAIAEAQACLVPGDPAA